MEWDKLHFEHLEHFLLRFCQDVHDINPTYSSVLLKEICGRYNRDLQRMSNDPDHYKKAATAIFWIKKIRPIYVTDGQPQFLNEAFAYYFGIGPILHNITLGTPIPAEYKPLVKEMLYALRYRSMSPQNMDFLLKAMYPRIIGR